jgi:hypothetical protein
MRAQANFPALAVALLALTAAMVVGLSVADGAFAAADRSTTEGQLAVGVSEYLVSPDGPLAARPNVVNASAADEFDESALRAAVPGLADRDVAVTLDDERIAATADDVDGRTVERVVLVERTQTVTATPAFDASNSVTLPRRTERIDVRIDPSANATVTALRVEDRVVRRNESGLAGDHELAASRYETATVTVEASGSLSAGDVELTYYPTQTRKALLGVTVDE